MPPRLGLELNGNQAETVSALPSSVVSGERNFGRYLAKLSTLAGALNY